METLESGKTILHVCPDIASMADAAAQEFARLAIEAVKERGYFSVALSGGSSPPHVYERLLQDDLKSTIPWDKIHYFIGDERCVADDSPENNFGVAKKLLLSRVNAPAENMHPLVGQDKNPAKSASDYSEELRTFFKLQSGQLPVFDLIWLGMGPDGHCASLFPGTKALTEVQRLVTENHVDKLASDRVTFTFPVINHARVIMFVVSGEDKSKVLAEVFESDAIAYPVQHVVPEHGIVRWYVDAAAARELAASPQPSS